MKPRPVVNTARLTFPSRYAACLSEAALLVAVGRDGLRWHEQMRERDSHSDSERR